jgi:uncharacterized protein (DUF302 family)
MDESLHPVASAYGAKETMDRCEAAARARGLTIFARIDHAAGAQAVGLPLRPTELLIFGDARVGTRLMQAAQTMGIELPLKVLVWEDAAGQTWLGYGDPRVAAARHGVAAELEPVTTKMAAALGELAAEATGRR